MLVGPVIVGSVHLAQPGFGEHGSMSCAEAQPSSFVHLQVVSTDAMDAYADWPTVLEDFRFDPLSPSDPTWHRYSDAVSAVKAVVSL